MECDDDDDCCCCCWNGSCVSVVDDDDDVVGGKPFDCEKKRSVEQQWYLCDDKMRHAVRNASSS